MSVAIKRIAVVGTGVIGSSWTTLFLAKGYNVIVSDPAEGAEERLRKYIQKEWPTMEKVGMAKGADIKNLEFVKDINEHLKTIDFIQENCPEKPDFKTKLIGQLDAGLPKGAIIASSSSGIPASQFIGNCKVAPGRVLIGHPFNPPHLIPLVEVVPHSGTDKDVVERATAFYKSLGKAPVLLHKEAPGFLANRLQGAVLAEAFSLVSRGIATPQDVDIAMSTGPGLRWALAGPFGTTGLGGGGGENGFGTAMEHLGAGLKGWVKDMSEHPFSFNDKDMKDLIEKVRSSNKEAGPSISSEKLAEGLIEVLKVKEKGDF